MTIPRRTTALVGVLLTAATALAAPSNAVAAVDGPPPRAVLPQAASPLPGDDQCHSAEYKFLVGAVYNPSAKTMTLGYAVVMTADQLPQPNIILTPEGIHSMLVNPRRLKIYYADLKGDVITDVTCG